MRTLEAMIRRVIYSVALLSVIPVYAAEEVPDAFKDVQLHEIQAAPDADLKLQSIKDLPLEKISEQLEEHEMRWLELQEMMS